MLLGKHRNAHIAEVAAPLLAVLLLSSRWAWKSRARLCGVCLLLLSGVLVHRYLIMPPAFNAQPLTFNPIGQQLQPWSYPVASGRWAEGLDTFSTTWNYFPSAIEWWIFGGVCAFACFGIGLGALLFPIAPKDKP